MGYFHIPCMTKVIDFRYTKTGEILVLVMVTVVLSLKSVSSEILGSQ